MSVISLSQARERSNAPDADCASMRAKNGRPEHQYRYAMVYELDGTEYSFDIWATSEAEAERHCRAIRAGAEYGGQIISKSAG